MNNCTTKIENQIACLQKKIEQLSGNYLTNTRKRQQEQIERDRRKDRLRIQKQLMVYLLSAAKSDALTPFEKRLITGAFYEDMHNLSASKKYCDKSEYRSFDYPRYDEARMKRLQKAGIADITQLCEAIADFDALLQTATTPRDKDAERLRNLVFHARLCQEGDIQFTPPELAAQVIALSGIHSGSRVLEPEAGIGNLSDDIKKITPAVDCIERMASFREILALKRHKLIADDLLEAEAVAEYDAVIMNPPFSRECEHIRKAFDFVKPGGTLTAICSTRITWKEQKNYLQFRDWLSGNQHEIIQPADCKFDKTATPTVILKIEKAA